MTIQGTIPTWFISEYAVSSPRSLFEKKLKREGKATLCIAHNYKMFSSIKPEISDRYYFRIKLKQK